MADEKDDVAPKVPNLALPFTLYDFFGYLLPGVVFWMTVLLSFDATHFALDLLTAKSPLWTADSQLKVFQAVQNLVKQSPWFVSISGALFCYITGHLISAVSSYFGERLFVEKILGYPGKNLFAEPDSEKKGCFRRLCSSIFSKFVRPYSAEFRTEFATRAQTVFGFSCTDASDRFWLAFEYVAHWCPSAFARSMHFLNLYGFNRNISYALVLAAILSATMLKLRCYPAPFLIPFLLLLTSLPFYWNYLKLFRRLNDEVFRAFFVHSKK